jgi:hypothetical protein
VIVNIETALGLAADNKMRFLLSSTTSVAGLSLLKHIRSIVKGTKTKMQCIIYNEHGQWAMLAVVIHAN